MKKNDSDIFEGLKEHTVNNNFFITPDDSMFNNTIKSFNEKGRRINDYDYNLLEEDAYKDINNELFKLEYKISKIERELKILEDQLRIAQEIKDYEQIHSLENRIINLRLELQDSTKTYNKKSFSANITDKFFNIFGKNISIKYSNMKHLIAEFSEIFLSKMPKSVISIIELKKSLQKLENINKSVDELISLNTPYGENINKYEKISKYIIKANSIQAKLSRSIKDNN